MSRARSNSSLGVGAPTIYHSTGRKHSPYIQLDAKCSHRPCAACASHMSGDVKVYAPRVREDPNRNHSFKSTCFRSDQSSPAFRALVPRLTPAGEIVLLTFLETTLNERYRRSITSHHDQKAR